MAIKLEGGWLCLNGLAIKIRTFFAASLREAEKKVVLLMAVPPPRHRLMTLRFFFLSLTLNSWKGILTIFFSLKFLD